VQNEVRPEQLQRALGAERFTSLSAKHGRPAQVIRRAGNRFFIRNAGFVLKQNRQRQQRRRHAGAAQALGIERRKVIVSEKSARRVR